MKTNHKNYNIRFEIIWPSIGYPQAVRSHKSEIISYVNIQPGNTIQKDFISSTLVTDDINSTQKNVFLKVIDIKSVDLKKNTEIGLFSTWVVNNNANTYRIVFSLSQPVTFRKTRNILYDLCIKIQGFSVTKKSSIFFINNNYKKRKVIVLSDVHIATRWDDIEKNVDIVFSERKKRIIKDTKELLNFNYSDIFTKECFDSTWINPNKNFAQLIKIANMMHSEGEIDFIVLLGDIVDYKYKKPKFIEDKSYKNTEWSFFIDILQGKINYSEKLRVPLFTTTGNHDYRLYPYSLQYYGISHNGISNSFLREYLKRTNQIRKVKYTLSDINAIRIKKGKNHSLDLYYMTINPMDIYSLDFDDIRMIFVNSGPDFYCCGSHLISSRSIRFISALLHNPGIPISNGYDEKQVKFILRTLQNRSRSTIFFTHAPFLNEHPKKKMNKTDNVLPIILNTKKNVTKRDIIQFEKTVIQNKLNYETIFYNHLPILKALCNLNNQTIVISGHTHRYSMLKINKQNGVISKIANEDFLKDFSSNLILIQTYSLSHIAKDYHEQTIPSYQVLEFKQNGTIDNIENIQINSKPYHKTFFNIHIQKETHSEIVRFIFGKSNDFDKRHNLIHKIVMLFLCKKNSHFTIDINCAPNLQVISKISSSTISNKKYNVYLIPDVKIAEFKIINRKANLKILFITESFIKKSENEYISLGLKLHHRKLK